VEGARQGLHGGFVVYTKEQKATALGISPELLSSRGSVNEDVAREMAEAALGRSRAALALAVTGVLGPDRDEDGNPVGLVFYALGWRGENVRVVKTEFSPRHHDALRHAVIMDALELVESELRSRI
jgi:nicotinamide-nucleotide amidase